MLYYVKSLMLLKFEDKVKIYLNMRILPFVITRIFVALCATRP